MAYDEMGGKVFYDVLFTGEGTRACSCDMQGDRSRESVSLI